MRSVPFASARRGFTLLEIMIAVAVLAVALVLVTMLLPGLNRSVDLEVVHNDLDLNANRALSDTVDRIRPGRVLSTPVAGMPFACGPTWVKYVLPVSGDVKGFFIVGVPTADGTSADPLMKLGSFHPDVPEHGMIYRLRDDAFVDYGWESSSESAMASLGARPYQFYEVIRFRASGKTFSEAEHDVDVDGDGKKNRTFILGCIERYFPAAITNGTEPMSAELAGTAGVERFAMTDDIVVWDPDWNPALWPPDDPDDAPLQLAPIFDFRDNTLRMSLTVVALTEQREPVVRTVATSVALRNQNLPWTDPER